MDTYTPWMSQVMGSTGLKYMSQQPTQCFPKYRLWTGTGHGCHRPWVAQAVSGTDHGQLRPGHNTSVVSLYMLLWLSPV